MSDFNTLYQQFQSTLNSNQNIVEISKEFTNEKDLKSMLQYMWSLPEFHEQIKAEKINSIKNAELSDSLRKLGNDFFKKRIINKALECYNKSIINAVNESESLSYAYANRSALLYEMKLYDLCLSDIKRSFLQNYPIHLHEKLILREIKCHFATNNSKLAKEIYNGYVTNEKYNYNDNLIKCLKRSMYNFEKEFQNEKIILNGQKTKRYQFNQIKKTNKYLPSVSDALEFTCSDKGRGFIAKRDIMPGDVLMKEKAYSAVLLSSCLHTHCSFCLQRIKYAPVPCIICTNVIFCDEKCREKANKLFHKNECSLFSTFEKMDMGKSSTISLRILCQTGPKELLKQFRVYEEECLYKDQSKIGFNPDGVYQADDLRTIFHLVTNKRLRKVPDLFKRCAISLTIFKLFATELDLTELPKLSIVNKSALLEEQVIVATCLFIFSMSLPCNAHSITEHKQNSVSCADSYLEDIGSGAFSTFSLLNHSCNPNMTRTTTGVEMMGIATQFITAGSEVIDSYGTGFAIEPLNRRQPLKEQYYFTCSCEACLGNWPMYHSLPVELTLICPNCSSNFDVIKFKCNKCKKTAKEITFLDGDRHIDFVTIFEKEIQLVKDFLTLTEKLADNSPTSDDVKLILEIITFVNKYCVLPARIIIIAQEYLKGIFDDCAFV